MRRMTASYAAMVGAAALYAASVTACIDITTHTVAAVGLDPMATPSVVVGDTLRDTLGVARPLRGAAYNAEGVALAGVPVIYRILDRGAHVDSLTGVVVGDSVGAIPVRVLVEAGGIQTQPVPLYIVPAPDSIVALNPLDTLAYSLRDSTSLSVALTAQLLHHGTAPALDSVQAYVVSFAVQYPSDTLLAQLVDDGGHPSHVDTTAADGTAGRRIKLRPARLPSLTVADSVVVYATARYHGTPVGRGPVRFVLRLPPAVP